MRLIHLNLFLLHYVIILTHVDNKIAGQEEVCLENNPNSCGDKQKGNEDLLYKELFLRTNSTSSEVNSTEIDFSIGEKIISYLHKYGILPFPKSRFVYKTQGNFLHFIQMAYSKRLPIYFTIDQILEPAIDTIHHIQRNYLEKAFLPLMDSFLSNIIYYLQNSSNSWLTSTQINDSLIYFGTAYSLLNFSNKDSISKLPPYIQTQCDINVNQILNQSNHSFSFMSMNKTLNLVSFNPYGIWKQSERLIQLNRCLKFFQNTVFDMTKELDTIITIGKIIKQSSQEKTYAHLKEMYKYLYDEHETNINPLKITQYLVNNSIAYPFASQNISDEFYKGIMSQARDDDPLPFRKNNTFSSKKAEEIFYGEYHYHSSLFYFPFSLDDWVNNKIIAPHKGRLIPSVFEEVDIEHNGDAMRGLINARYRGNKEKAGKLYKFRDGVDLRSDFRYAKQAIQSSMKNNTAQWRSNIISHFHYLLYLSSKSIYRDKKKYTKEQYQASKIKLFQTLMGADVNYQRDIHIYKQSVNITYGKGEIVDSVLEDNSNFYKELDLLLSNYKVKVIESIALKHQMTKEEGNEFVEEVNRLITPIQSGISLILDGIEMQKDPLLYDHGLQSKLNQLFYYDEQSNEYKGWYVDMFRSKEKGALFDFDLYIKNYYTLPPIKKIDFAGVVIYKSMNFPEIGLMISNVAQTNVKKLLTYCSYSGNEYPHKWEEKISLQGLLQLILKRE